VRGKPTEESRVLGHDFVLSGPVIDSFADKPRIQGVEIGYHQQSHNGSIVYNPNGAGRRDGESGGEVLVIFIP